MKIIIKGRAAAKSGTQWTNVSDIQTQDTANIEVNESRYRQCGVSPHYSKSIEKIKILIKENIVTINWEKLFGRSADHK